MNSKVNEWKKLKTANRETDKAPRNKPASGPTTTAKGNDKKKANGKTSYANKKSPDEVTFHLLPN